MYEYCSGAPQSGTPLKLGNCAELVEVAVREADAAELLLVLDTDNELDPLRLELSSEVLELEAPQTNEEDWRKMTRDNGRELGGKSMGFFDKKSKITRDLYI